MHKGADVDQIGGGLGAFRQFRLTTIFLLNLSHFLSWEDYTVTPGIWALHLRHSRYAKKGVRGVWTGKSKKVRDQKEQLLRAVVGGVPNCLVASLHSLDYANFGPKLTY